jgi:hypothetical protein
MLIGNGSFHQTICIVLFAGVSITTLVRRCTKSPPPHLALFSKLKHVKKEKEWEATMLFTPGPCKMDELLTRNGCAAFANNHSQRVRIHDMSAGLSKTRVWCNDPCLPR